MNRSGICFYRPKPKTLHKKVKIITLKERNLYFVHKSVPKYPNYLNSAKKVD